LKKITTILLLLFAVALFGQRPAKGIWVTAVAPINISSKWQIHNDVSYRTLGSSASLLQYLHRTGIRYNITSNWSATLGVAATFTRSSFAKENHEFARELRLWQEALYKTNLTKQLQLQTRLRTEERWFEATNTKASSHAFRYRLRAQLQQKFTAKWAALIADEYMQQHAKGNWSFDQNRLIISGVYFLNAQTQLQAGYLWFRLPANTSQHIVNLTFQKTISLHGKSK
jgi:Protein of unknown function (DUF2490)